MMAESQLQDAFEELLTCAFCLRGAVDPKSLDCQHTFCLICLKRFIKTKHVKDKIACPTCRQWSNLPNGGPECLRVNFVLNQLIDAANKPVKHMTLTDGASGSALEQKQDVRYCDKHPDELIKVYCEDCKMSVCSFCCLSFHSQHIWVELSKKSAKAKTEIKHLLQQVGVALKNVKVTEIIMKEKAAKVEKDGAIVKQEVNMALMAQEASINEDVDQACHQTRKQLKAESDRLSVTLATLESIELCGEKLLQHGNPADYMMTVPVLVKQLHDNNPDKMTYLMDDVDLTSVKQRIEDIKNLKETRKELQLKETRIMNLVAENHDLKDCIQKGNKAITDLRKLENTHTASAETLKPSTAEQPQPDGGSWNVRKDIEYYSGQSLISMTCEFPAGIQTAAHPNPGKGYQAAKLTGLLPDVTDSEELCRRLERAFMMGVLVTVRDNELRWNGLDLLRNMKWHHSGFPLDYLPRIKDQLDSWGIQ